MYRKFFLFMILCFGTTANLNAEEKNDYVVGCCESFPDTCCSWGHFNVSADYLYWRPCVDGVYVALENNYQILGEEILNEKTKVIYPGFEGKSGVRLGVRYESECTPYDIGVSWTFYQPKGSRARKVNLFKDGEPPELNLLAPFRGLPLDDLLTNLLPNLSDEEDEIGLNIWAAPAVLSVKGKYRMSLNVLDLEFGRECFPWECVVVRPHLDLRFLSLKQRLRTKSEGAFLGAFQESPSEQPNIILGEGIFSSKEKISQHFRGIGPRLGLDTQWTVCKGWGIYADGAVSMLYGEAHIDDKGGSSFFGEPQDEDPVRAFDLKRKSRKYCTRVVTDFAVGLYWERCLCEGQYTFVGKIGWEHHYFPSQSLTDLTVTRDPFIRAPMTITGDNDVTIQGLTVSASFEY